MLDAFLCHVVCKQALDASVLVLVFDQVHVVNRFVKLTQWHFWVKACKLCQGQPDIGVQL